MKKNILILLSLFSVYTLNSATSTWMPNKKNALAYAASGLVATTGILLYHVCQLKKNFTALETQFKCIEKATSQYALCTINDRLMAHHRHLEELQKNSVTQDQLTQWQVTLKSLTQIHMQNEAQQITRATNKQLDEFIQKHSKKAIKNSSLGQSIETLKKEIMLIEYQIRLQQCESHLIRAIQGNKASTNDAIDALKKELSTIQEQVNKSQSQLNLLSDTDSKTFAELSAKIKSLENQITKQETDAKVARMVAALPGSNK